jgi:hypothetical protein
VGVEPFEFTSNGGGGEAPSRRAESRFLTFCEVISNDALFCSLVLQKVVHLNRVFKDKAGSPKSFYDFMGNNFTDLILYFDSFAIRRLPFEVSMKRRQSLLTLPFMKRYKLSPIFGDYLFLFKKRLFEFALFTPSAKEAVQSDFLFFLEAFKEAA